MRARLTHVIKFVADMDTAVRFYQRTLGLELRLSSPGWTEFATGDVTLALHPASAANPAGSFELGFGVDDLRKTYDDRAALGLNFVSEPKPLHGTLLATFLDSENTRCTMSVSLQAP
jgi:catechol 2,3-dioxygenase-like lactoylglutathione lyase family enzyme